MFLGLSKLFVLVASYEYAYLASRRSGRSFFMGIRYFAISASAFIDSLYIHVFPGTDTTVNFVVCYLSIENSYFVNRFIFVVSNRS